MFLIRDFCNEIFLSIKNQYHPFFEAKISKKKKQLLYITHYHVIYSLILQNYKKILILYSFFLLKSSFTFLWKSFFFDNI